MKKLCLCVLLLLPTLAAADETYSLTASGTLTTGQLGILDGDRIAKERQLCARYNLTVGGTCTQGALCTAAGAAGGSSCSASQARAANVRLYPNSQAGREEFLQFDWIAPVFQVRKRETQADAATSYCIWWAAQNATTRNAECAKVGKPDNCEICPP